LLKELQSFMLKIRNFNRGVNRLHHIEIRRPTADDKEELNHFFSKVIIDTFEKEGLSELHEDLENEMKEKKQFLESDLGSNGETRHFLLAIDKNQNKIVGSIAYGPANELINTCTEGALKDLIEIGTVFVHPEYQRRGIGTLLLNVMLLTLQNKGIKEFCLDSGYTSAQQVWQKKFGEPDYLMKDYWGKGSDHMIWKKSLNDVSIVFSV
jgi:GNAT superfamily N-acetyltransferase